MAAVTGYKSKKFQQGEIGVEFFANICTKLGYKYQPATPTQDQAQGIDCFVSTEDQELKVDVKNGRKIVFGNLKASGTFFARHPFNIHTKATHYAFVDCKTSQEGKFLGIKNIKEFLLEHFFKTPETLESFYNLLFTIHGKDYQDLGELIPGKPSTVSSAQASFQLKMFILGLVKPDVYVTYSLDEESREYNFRLGSTGLDNMWNKLETTSFKKTTPKKDTKKVAIDAVKAKDVKWHENATEIFEDIKLNYPF